MFDPASTSAALTPDQRDRLRELLHARKLPHAPIDDDLQALRLLNPRPDASEVSELNNWGWQVAMLID
jgi:hypothetical protein